MSGSDNPKMDTAAAMEVLAQTSMPLEVGEIEFDETGSVRPRTNDQPVSFNFSYHGIKFEGFVPADDTQPMQLYADLGVIPYSIENGFGRKAARSIIQRAHMPNGHLTVDQHSRVHLILKNMPEKPRTPVNVLSAVAALLMEAKPYLDLLEVSLRRQKRRSKRPLE